MAVRNRARTEEEFICLHNQALYDIFDLRAGMEFDDVFMDDAPLIVKPLNNGLTRLMNAVKSGQYEPGKEDRLDFLHVFKNTDQRVIPSWPAPKLIPNTHTEGYQGE